MLLQFTADLHLTNFRAYKAVNCNFALMRKSSLLIFMRLRTVTFSVIQILLYVIEIGYITVVF